MQDLQNIFNPIEYWLNRTTTTKKKGCIYHIKLIKHNLYLFNSSQMAMISHSLHEKFEHKTGLVLSHVTLSFILYNI